MEQVKKFTKNAAFKWLIIVNAVIFIAYFFSSQITNAAKKVQGFPLVGGLMCKALEFLAKPFDFIGKNIKMILIVDAIIIIILLLIALFKKIKKKRNKDMPYTAESIDAAAGAKGSTRRMGFFKRSKKGQENER